ncbi:MAG: hypothetical protein Q8P71_02235 [bacterium]|nr:hypothetical protein [bacterium]
MADQNQAIALSTPNSSKPAQCAYTIKDNIGGEIDIRLSANAWWNNVARVRQLITALKRGHSQRNAALCIGISKDQLHYFLKLHPEFYDKIEDFREVLSLKIIDAIAEAIERGDAQTIRWAAERLMPEIYGRQKMIPAVAVPVVSMREVRKRYEYEPAIENHGQSSV